MSGLDLDSKGKVNDTIEDMGDVIGKEPDEAEEMSPEFREDADGAPSSDETGASSVENQIYSCDDDSDISEEAAGKDDDDDDESPCSCEVCVKDRKLAENTVEEMRRLQTHWLELRQYIRMVYRMAMAMEDVKTPTDGYQYYIKDHVQKLCLSDPHQLFQRLESQVQEFVIETKVKQLELLKEEKGSPVLPYLFISGLLDSYKRLMTAASDMAPLLEQLQSEHLSKFNLTWRVLNQHLFQSCVYTDPFVQNKIPECIAKLSNSSPDPGDTNKNLVREFLGFDDEITLVGSMWREAETKIHQYNQEQATIKAKQRMMKEDWEFFKAQRKLIQHKIWNKTNSGLSESSSSCPCEECSAVSHLLGCSGLVTPPHSPHPPASDSGGRIEGEGKEQAENGAECECHICTGPPIGSSVVDLNIAGVIDLNHHGDGFNLYPHIHGTSEVVGGNVDNVYPHLYNIHSSLLANSKHHTRNSSSASTVDQKKQVQSGEPKAGPALRPSTPPVPLPAKRPDPPPPPAELNTAKPISTDVIGQTKAVVAVKPHRHSTTQTTQLPDVVPPSCHSHGHPHTHPNKRVQHTHSSSVNGKAQGCHGHGSGKDSCSHETSPDDSCSDRSSSTQRGDSRHCDCCYCEVFGHGVPSVAPVSRNYTEMRERLRQLLTKKKAECKTAGNTQSPAPVAAAPPLATETATTTTTSNLSNTIPVNGEVKKTKDPRDLEELIDFIEGNPSKKCLDEKKVAKKARQKQKKLEEIERKRKEEEEAERRKIEEEEAARAQLKQQRKDAKKLKKKKKALEALAKQEGSSVPQMVTIKRVMEPNSSEPTVTITLRGATPGEDKVLYTLLNVCQLPATNNNQKTNNSNSKNAKNNPKPLKQAQSNPQTKLKNGSNVNNIQQQGQINKAKKEQQNNEKNQITNHNVNNQKKKEEVSAKLIAAPAPIKPPPPIPPPPTAPKLNSPTAIQINNAINRLSSRPHIPNNFNFESLNLPPGITITKVDPSQVTQQRKPIAQPAKPTPPPTVTAPPLHSQMSHVAASNVIVVDTGKLKDFTSVPSKDLSENTSGKKKKKKKNGNGNINNINGNPNCVPVNVEPVNNNMVRLTMNGGPPKRIMTAPQPQNGKVMMPPQAAIIKVNGSMVTIRSPALQQALNANQQDTDNSEQSKKKKKKKKGGNGQQQEDSWNIDEESVFAPKDIDLENGEMDDAERELEAFKRFCLQSVPPKRKEKVHLNIKDIVLKKKSSAISCN